MKLKPKLIQQTKDYFYKKSGLVLTDEEASEYLLSLTKFGFLLLEMERPRGTLVAKVAMSTFWA